MQDYIFNSKRQRKQRANRRNTRLIGLLIVVAGVAFAIHYFTGSEKSGADTTPVKTDNSQNDTLILPNQDSSKSGVIMPEKKLSPLDDSSSSTEKPTATPQTASTNESADVAAPESSTSTSVISEITEPATDVKPASSLNWTDYQIKPGDNLAAIFKQHNLTPALLHRIVNSSETAACLAKIRPGQSVHFAMSQDQRLQQLKLERSRISTLRITLSDTDITAEELTRDLESRKKSTRGRIKSSLFLDGQAAGLSDRLIMELAKVFGWDIDFALDVMPGDSFIVIYDEQYLDNEKYADGSILAAEFINQGKVFRAVRYTDQEGNSSYYDDTGHAKMRAFIRTPVKFSRISSGFTRKRWHPVLKKWRSHKGVDYAAPRGTPIKAAGTGKVVFKGKKGGYGNVIFLRHGGKYTTVYGHLSKFAKNLQKGGKVKQGQVIGYVGSTGLATGPHLHYEFRVNGVHRNPLTVKLPKSIPLPKKKMEDFKHQTASVLAALEKEKASSMVASTR